MLKTKQLGNSNYHYIQPTILNLKSIVADLACGLPGKKGKLDMITSTVANKYAVMRSFGSTSVVDLSSFFFWKT